MGTHRLSRATTALVVTASFARPPSNPGDSAVRTTSSSPVRIPIMRANGRLAPATAHAHPPVMFSVTEAGATAIRDAFRQRGELSAVIELRRLFPGVTDNRQARECVRIIAGWGLSEPDRSRPSGPHRRDKGVNHFIPSA